MRNATVTRTTAETSVNLTLGLDSYAEEKIALPIPFFHHMLSQIALHGRVMLDVQASGDIDVDGHHLVEDVGIVFGQALHKALGDKKGIARYANAYVALDESLSRVVIDCSGRPGLHYRVDYTAERIGDFDVQWVREFFQGLVNHAGITLHIDNLHGENAHHQVESIFKAFGQALRRAVIVEGAILPSTKRHL